MTIKLNGVEKKIEKGIAITGMLEILEIIPEQIAVEVNLNIISTENYSSHFLKEGDVVEIVNFLGGG